MASPTVSPLVRYGALGIAVVGVSFSAVFIRLSDAPALVVATNRMLGATLLLLPPLLLVDRGQLIGLSRHDLAAAALSGLFLAFHFGLWTVSLGYTSVASSVVFVSTHPIFVALAELALFKRSVQAIGAVGIGLTMLGSIVIGGGDLRLGDDAVYGDALAVGGAIALVGYLLIGRRLRRRLGFLTYSVLVYAACWAVLALGTLLSGASLAYLEPRDLTLYLALAAVSTIGGHTVFNWALRHVSASLVAAAFVGEPVVAALLAWLFLAEPISGTTAMGGGVILLGIYLTARGS